jgi:hypothetical protein
VLADLQAGQVEAERLRLPDELLELAVGLAARAGGGQGVLQQPQVGDELRGAGVGQAGLLGLRAARQPGGPQPQRREQQELPVRLLR